MSVALASELAGRVCSFSTVRYADVASSYSELYTFLGSLADSTYMPRGAGWLAGWTAEVRGGGGEVIETPVVTVTNRRVIGLQFQYRCVFCLGTVSFSS